MAQVIDAQGKVVREQETPEAFSGSTDGKANAIYRAVFREMANPRAGTASTKKRDEVRGGGKKPWRQKGTGRARQGSIRSPQWAHGGVVFGPQPRSYISSLNKKERRAAMRAALADKFQHGGITVLDTTSLDVTKTKAFATLLFGSPKAAKTGVKTLVVFATDELATSARRCAARARTSRRSRSRTPASSTSRTWSGTPGSILTTAAHDALVGKYTKESK